MKQINLMKLSPLLFLILPLLSSANETALSKIEIPLNVKVSTLSVQDCIDSALLNLKSRGLILDEENTTKAIEEKCESLDVFQSPQAIVKAENEIKLRLDGYILSGNSNQYNANVEIEYKIKGDSNNFVITAKSGVFGDSDSDSEEDELKTILLGKIEHNYKLKNNLAIATTFLASRDDNRGEDLKTEELIGFNYAINGNLDDETGLNYSLQVGHKYLAATGTDQNDNTLIVSQSLKGKYNLSDRVSLNSGITGVSNPFDGEDYEVSTLSTITIKDIVKSAFIKNLNLTLIYEGIYDNLPQGGKEEVDHAARIAFDFKFKTSK